MSQWPNLEWIYSFWRALSPYAYARAEDEVVILPPNLVYKTNSTGVRLLDYMGKGGRFEDIPGFDANRARDVESFFLSLKAAYDGKPFALDRVSYDFQFTRLPILGEIALTYRCGNRCRFCYAGCGDDQGLSKAEAPGSDELSTDGFKRIIDLFKEQAKIPFFSFTGGEPLIRPDVETLTAYALSRGLRVNLVSNGRLATPQRAKSLYEAGLRTAQISLEAATDGLHDELCGAKGAFRDSVAGIRALLEAGISVQTNSTLTRANREALLELPAFVAHLGVRRMSMNLFIPVGSGSTASDLFIPYSECGAFVDEVRRRAHQVGVDFMWYSPTPLCLYNPIARGLGNKSCAACDGLISVSPSGDLLPCSSWPERIGNLLTEGFESLWFGKEAIKHKQKSHAPEGCQSCSSFTACQGACPLYWRYAGCRELSRCEGVRS